MNIFKVYQLWCCIFACKLLCLLSQTALAEGEGSEALKLYFTSIRGINAVFAETSIKFNGAKKVLCRYKKWSKKARYKRKRNIHVNYPTQIIAPIPTNTIKCRLFCRSGFYVQLLPNGIVKGTIKSFDNYVFLEMQSFGLSIVRIKGIHSQRYLTVDRKGRFKAKRHPRLGVSLFKEVHEENYYNTYSSFKYYYDEPYDIFLGLRATGQLKKTWKAYPGQIATQFLVIKDFHG